MALEKGVNSYVSVDEADTYFADRIDVAAWDNASDDQKVQSLVTATAILNEMDWIGVAISETQTLAFPREGVYYDPFLGKEIELSNSIPSRIIKATHEIAYHLLNNDGLLDDTGTIRSLTLGQLSLDSIITPSKIPSHTAKLIRPLLRNRGSYSWWRAN